MATYISAQARAAIQRAMKEYAPGGGFGKGVEAGLERGRTQATSSGMQNLVSAGLAGTTMAAGLGKKYEEEVAAPTRARVEDIRSERISALETILAQMEQGGYQAAVGRQFQAGQSALNRLMQPQPTNPYMQNLGGGQAPSVTQPVKTPTVQSTPQMPVAPDVTASAKKAYTPSWTPGEWVASVTEGGKTDRYVYNQEGQIVKESEYNASRTF